MLFSIVIPAYNSEKFIKRCLESVIEQDFDDYEIIVVNDGSTDKTSDIVRLMNDSRIKLIEKQNTGVSDTRNIGLLNSIGRYVIFMDSDDTLPSGTLPRLSRCITENVYSPDIIFGYYSRFNDCNGKENLQVFNYESDLSDVRELEIWTRLFCGGKIFSMPIMAQVYRRDFLIENDLFFDKGQFVSEDHDWRYKLLLKAKRYFNCGFCLYNYCENNATSVTNTAYTFKKYENSVQYLFRWSKFSLSEQCPNVIRNILQNIVSQDYINHALRIFDIQSKDERKRALDLFRQNDWLLKFAKPIKYKLFNVLYYVLGARLYCISINYAHRIKCFLFRKNVY